MVLEIRSLSCSEVESGEKLVDRVGYCFILIESGQELVDRVGYSLDTGRIGTETVG